MVQEDPSRVPPHLQRRLSEAGQEFLIDILSAETERNPENLAALADLGHLYTRLGRHEEGLGVDRRLVRLDPTNPVVHYNLACSLSLLGRLDAALDALDRAVEAGYADAEHLVGDDDLAALRAEPRFQDLVQRLREGETHSA